MSDRIDSLAQFNLVSIIHEAQTASREIKSRQLVGGDTQQIQEIKTDNKWDIETSMDVEFKTFMVYFTPNTADDRQGVAYKLLIRESHDGLGTITQMRLPMHITNAPRQGWRLIFQNLTRQPGSLSPTTFTMRAKLYVLGTEQGTLQVI